MRKTLFALGLMLTGLAQIGASQAATMQAHITGLTGAGSLDAVGFYGPADSTVGSLADLPFDLLIEWTTTPTGFDAVQSTLDADASDGQSSSLFVANGGSGLDAGIAIFSLMISAPTSSFVDGVSVFKVSRSNDASSGVSQFSFDISASNNGHKARLILPVMGFSTPLALPFDGTADSSGSVLTSQGATFSLLDDNGETEIFADLMVTSFSITNLDRPGGDPQDVPLPAAFWLLLTAAGATGLAKRVQAGLTASAG